MTYQFTNFHGRAIGGQRIFPSAACSFFSVSYPEGAVKLEHNLANHPLLELDKLALLGESLPDHSIRFAGREGSVTGNGKQGPNGLTIGDTIRQIESCDSWVTLRNVQAKRPFKALLDELIDELRPMIDQRTGEPLSPQAHIHIVSPNARTPLHFDAEHALLLELRGTKFVTVFRAGDPRFAPDELHEAYHRSGQCELPWKKEFKEEGITLPVEQGQAIYMPVLAPHFAKNGPEVAISMSIRWRSEWGKAEADARSFNALLRKFGMKPQAPKRWPATNAFKATAMRIARRIPGVA